MPDRKLMPIAPPRLAAVWPQVRGWLANIESPDGWLAEDVYLLCKTNGATLYLIQEDGVPCGCLVLRALHDFDGPRLHIWLLYADGFDVMTEFSGQLDDLARQIGATRITFSSTRKGWAKTAPKHGFSVRETVYQRNVT